MGSTEAAGARTRPALALTASRPRRRHLAWLAVHTTSWLGKEARRGAAATGAASGCPGMVVETELREAAAQGEARR